MWIRRLTSIPPCTSEDHQPVGWYTTSRGRAQVLFASYGLLQIHWGIGTFVTFVIVTLLGPLLLGEVAIVLALDASRRGAPK